VTPVYAALMDRIHDQAFRYIQINQQRMRRRNRADIQRRGLPEAETFAILTPQRYRAMVRLTAPFRMPRPPWRTGPNTPPPWRTDQ
jgi:hypothetical protein